MQPISTLVSGCGSPSVEVGNAQLDNGYQQYHSDQPAVPYTVHVQLQQDSYHDTQSIQCNIYNRADARTDFHSHSCNK